MASWKIEEEHEEVLEEELVGQVALAQADYSLELFQNFFYYFLHDPHFCALYVNGFLPIVR
jgi:hypothetical protein